MKMRKSMKCIAVFLAASIVSALCLTAAAAEPAPEQADDAALSVMAPIHQMKAQYLYRLGLFQGTPTGFHLDEAATRAQAATMCVRLFGAEDEALENNYTHPFTDVPSWADAYVGYMYQYGLTTGAGEATFDSDGACTMQMFDAFMLRALGFSESQGDYFYADTQMFADELGLNAETDPSTGFLRGDMVAIAYAALLSMPKDAEFDSLLEKLADEEKVAEELAANSLSVLSVYQDYLADSAGLIPADTEALSLQMSADMDFDIEAAELGVTQTIAMSASGDIAVILDQGKPAMQMSMLAELMGTSVDVDMYYADGICYIEAGGEKIKMEMPMDTLGLDEQAMTSATPISGTPLYLLEDMTKHISGGTTSYAITVSGDSFESMLGQALAAAGTDGYAMHMDSMTIEVAFTGGDRMSMAMDMALTMEMEGQEMTMSASANIDIVVTGTGDEVVITAPEDLDEYVDMDDVTALPAVPETEPAAA